MFLVSYVLNIYICNILFLLLVKKGNMIFLLHILVVDSILVTDLSKHRFALTKRYLEMFLSSLGDKTTTKKKTKMEQK